MSAERYPFLPEFVLAMLILYFVSLPLFAPRAKPLSQRKTSLAATPKPKKSTESNENALFNLCPEAFVSADAVMLSLEKEGTKIVYRQRNGETIPNENLVDWLRQANYTTRPKRIFIRIDEQVDSGDLRRFVQFCKTLALEVNLVVPQRKDAE